MAKLKGTTFRDMVELFHGRKSDTLTIGNNTTVTRIHLGPDCSFVVRLHGHDIVHLMETGVWFSNAGYPTVTTRERLNQFGHAYGVRFFQKDHEQFVTVRGDGTRPFNGSIYIGRKAWS